MNIHLYNEYLFIEKNVFIIHRVLLKIYRLFKFKADKTYELQLHKYLVANLRPDKGILKQDLKKGIDKYSFKYDINSTSKDGVSEKYFLFRILTKF